MNKVKFKTPGKHCSSALLTTVKQKLQQLIYGLPGRQTDLPRLQHQVLYSWTLNSLHNDCWAEIAHTRTHSFRNCFLLQVKNLRPALARSQCTRIDFCKTQKECTQRLHISMVCVSLFLNLKENSTEVLLHRDALSMEEYGRDNCAFLRTTQ